jgi:hypothetical protein
MPAFRSRFLFLASIAALGGAHPARAMPPEKPSTLASETKRPIDQERIHALYTEGDFERAIAAIDSFTHANGSYAYGDSVFIAKHLAVMYTANPDTREKGKGYMFKLLDLVPSAKIVDMFVSDEIDRIFEKIREEYVVRQQVKGNGRPGQVESNRYALDRLSGKAAADGPHGAQETNNNGSSHPGYWIAGGAAAIAVGVAAYFYFSAAPAKDKEYAIPQ